MYRGSSGRAGGSSGKEHLWVACVWDSDGKLRGAGLNYLPLAHGSPAERQALTFGKGAIVCVGHSVVLCRSK